VSLTHNCRANFA